MTAGTVIFAVNNEIVDYVSMAAWSAKRIRHFLNLPTTIVTDKPVDNKNFDQVIVVDKDIGNRKFYQEYNKVSDWHNTSRPSVYDLSPYDQTLVLDADYVVNSQQLSKLLDSDRDFLCHRLAYDVTESTTDSWLNQFGKFKWPMAWATVMYFKKSLYSKSVFDAMTMIKNNWQHYRNLYQISNQLYRNDFALSIALNIINGHSVNFTAIPWSLITLVSNYQLKLIENNKFCLEYNQGQSRKYLFLTDQDFHCLDKSQLGEIIEHS
jgi:hypothetical protein